VINNLDHLLLNRTCCVLFFKYDLNHSNTIPLISILIYHFSNNLFLSIVPKARLKSTKITFTIFLSLTINFYSSMTVWITISHENYLLKSDWFYYNFIIFQKYFNWFLIINSNIFLNIDSILIGLYSIAFLIFSILGIGIIVDVFRPSGLPLESYLLSNCFCIT